MKRIALAALMISGCSFTEPTRVVEDLELTDLTPVQAVSLVQGRGDTVVTGEVDDKVTLRVRVLGPDSDSADARVLSALHMTLGVVDETTVAEVWIDDDATGYTLRTELLVPAGLALSVRDDSGDLEIEGVGALDVTDGSGDLVVTGVSGDARVTDGSGGLVVRDVSGSLELVDGSGDLDVSGIGGDVSVEDGSGDLHIADVTGDVDLTDGSGDVHLETIGGLATVFDGSGDIVVGSGVEMVLEENGSGEVR